MFLTNLISLFKPKEDGSLAVSKFFKKIFEAKNTRLILGIGLAVFLIIIGPFGKPTAASTKKEAVLVRPKEVVIHTETLFRHPVDGFISQGYHWYHPAIDIAAGLTRPVYPIAKGKVREVKYGRLGYGHKVVIRHDNNTSSLYAHLDKIKVKPNQEVDKNTVIGTIGLTGWTTGPHLHLEIWENNHPINPLAVLPEFSFANY